jgi:hypothetical protein
MLFQCFSRLARKSFGNARRAASRAETMTSTGGRSCWFKRKDSRASRLIRLRATALPNVRVAIANPKRAQLASFRITDRLKYAHPSFLPCRRTVRNSAGRCRRLWGSKVSLLLERGIVKKSCAMRQGQRRLRPFARRRASKRRPLLVAMRARKPCVRARCRLLGLKVRFIAQLQRQNLWGKSRGKSRNCEICERRQGYLASIQVSIDAPLSWS